MTGNQWLKMIGQNPGHSAWYIERFRAMAADGADLHGEARMVDAMVSRGARILDAGCGPGRLGGRLAELGHSVIGVDIDPELIAAARTDHPDVTWLTGDLAELDLAAAGHGGDFDVIVSAGNVMTFIDPATRRPILSRLAAHLAADGRLVIGFGAGRGYPFDEFFADAEHAGLQPQLQLATWDLQPLTSTSDFLVAIFAAA